MTLPSCCGVVSLRAGRPYPSIGRPLCKAPPEVLTWGWGWERSGQPLARVQTSWASTPAFAACKSPNVRVGQHRAGADPPADPGMAAPHTAFSWRLMPMRPRSPGMPGSVGSKRLHPQCLFSHGLDPLQPWPGGPRHTVWLVGKIVFFEMSGLSLGSAPAHPSLDIYLAQVINLACFLACKTRITAATSR